MKYLYLITGDKISPIIFTRFKEANDYFNSITSKEEYSLTEDNIELSKMVLNDYENVKFYFCSITRVKYQK